MMKASTTYTLILVVFFIGAWLWKSSSVTPKKDEIVLDGIHISRKPCISAMNELLGKGVDSSRLCDCLIPGIYEIVKEDSVQLEKFKETGAFNTGEDFNERFAPLMENCIRGAFIDSNAVFQITGDYATVFKKKLKLQLDSMSDTNQYNTELLADCIIDKLNGNITLAEYLAPDYLENKKIADAIFLCAAKSK